MFNHFSKNHLDWRYDASMLLMSHYLFSETTIAIYFLNDKFLVLYIFSLLYEIRQKYFFDIIKVINSYIREEILKIEFILLGRNFDMTKTSMLLSINQK